MPPRAAGKQLASFALSSRMYPQGESQALATGPTYSLALCLLSAEVPCSSHMGTRTIVVFLFMSHYNVPSSPLGARARADSCSPLGIKWFQYPPTPLSNPIDLFDIPHPLQHQPYRNIDLLSAYHSALIDNRA